MSLAAEGKKEDTLLVILTIYICLKLKETLSTNDQAFGGIVWYIMLR